MRPSRTKHGHINSGIVAAFLFILADVFTVATCCHMLPPAAGRLCRRFSIPTLQMTANRYWRRAGRRAKQKWRHGDLHISKPSVFRGTMDFMKILEHVVDDSHGPSWTWFHASPCQRCQVSRIGAVIVLPEASGVHIYEGDKRYNKPTIWGWLILYKP